MNTHTEGQLPQHYVHKQKCYSDANRYRIKLSFSQEVAWYGRVLIIVLLCLQIITNNYTQSRTQILAVL